MKGAVRWLRGCRRPRGTLTFILAASALTGCSNSQPVDSAASAQAVSVSQGSAMVHGDHTPKYGGVVLMNGDLHFEVALKPSGDYRVYFSDAARNELPAAVASDVTITVKQGNGASEIVRLQIDESGESWVGNGETVSDEATAVARLAYTFQGEPYWIDLPFRIPNPAALDPHKKPAVPTPR